MACPGEGILTDLTRRLVDKTIKEVNYFRHFKTHDHEFKQDKQRLIRKLEEVHKDIEDAKRNNEYQIKGEVQDWIKEADNLIQNKAEIRQTRFGSWCPLSQYQQGKRLSQRTLIIKDHIKKSNFEKVTHPAELLDMKYHASRDFIDFESRKTNFKQLVEALEDGNHYMIGLQGMGGTGKTTLATQVGKQVEESKAFEKVIFVVVSNSPDVNKIQGDIARQLGLRLEEREEADHSKLLWSTIYKKEKKLLIILDDVWGELNLAEIGIPSRLDHKNCYVLITTRHLKVCRAMRCQQIVHLRTLDDDDALHLFLFHARSDDDSSRNELEGLARDFLKECGGLPVIIVALASILRNRHVGELNAVLAALQKSKSFIDVDEDLVEVYSCLRLSYDYLHNEKAQKLFLLCSIFPEDYEFPINLISRLGIGLGIFEETNDYCATRSQALTVKNKLIDSSLLQKVEEKECVKMHDLVREVAQWIAKEDIQVIKDSRTTLETNKRFVFWSTDDFPNQFDGTKVEILLLWISRNVLVNDPNAFFAGMSRLKILFLLGEYGRKFTSSSLSQSLLSLKNIHTLILDGWELGDISILKNIQSLVTLEFKNCLIIELPMNIIELKKLRWLGLRKCEIQRNNPFEVIKKCSQLEELYFVKNYNVKDWNTQDDKEIEDEIGHDISLAQLQIFSIAYDVFERFSNDDDGLLRCFNPKHIKHLIPDALFKYLVRSAEVLEMGKIGRTTWKNLAPDIIPLENGGMDNLIKLYLYEWDDFECLIDNSKYPYSNATFFSKLIELHLYGVGVKKLYWGVMPSRFLWQLQILKLEKCMKLQNLFFDENIKLPYLKVLTLIGCPMLQSSIFQGSVAQSLQQLERLIVLDCMELKSLIAGESLKQEMYGLVLPALKFLQISKCGKLEMVFSLMRGDLPKLEYLSINDCEELKYIFGEYRAVGQVLQQEIILPLLTEVTLGDVPSFISIFQNCKKCVLRPPQIFKEDLKEKHENSKTSVFSLAHGCCFLSSTKDTNIGVPNPTMEHHIISQGSCATNCLMRQPLSLKNIREMTLMGCSKLKSLFSVSIATTMILLERLYIRKCEELKQIISTEAEDNDYLNCTSIFPKLQSLFVSNCNKLEFIFPSTLFGGLHKLKSINIDEVAELKYVFGKYGDEECVSNENENKQIQIHLPALETLTIQDAPKMIKICAKKYYMSFPSLQRTVLRNLQGLQQLNVTASKGSCATNCLMRQPLGLQNIREMILSGCSKLKSLFSVSIATTMIMLEYMDIKKCEELKQIVSNEAEDDDYLDCTSIFPKLQSLHVSNCNKLEFIFPSTLFGGLHKLQSININKAAELKYVFGEYDDKECASNENKNNRIQIHLPALETLTFKNVPKMINICAKKYYMSFPSLQSIELKDLQEFNERSFLHLMAYLQGLQLNVTAPKDWMKISKDVQKLTRLGVRFLKIEEVLDLEGVEIEGPEMTLSLKELRLRNLSELRHVWKGPKYILSLHNLQYLYIAACTKLRAIFSVSIVKSLPQLFCLNIEDCDELVDIIEERDEDHLHQICFLKLDIILIKRCNSLKCLMSISTCGMFPKLRLLKIEEASKLEQVFIHKQDDLQKTTKMEEVFPELSNVTLKKLPRLTTICEGIDFQSRAHAFNVDDCPKYQEINHIQEGSENGDFKNQAATSALPNFAESSKDAIKTSVEEVVSSMSKEERLKEIEAKDPTRALEEQAPKASTADEWQLRRSPLQSKEEKLKEIEAKDPTRALEEQVSKASIADEPQLRRSPLQNNKEIEKEDGRVALDPALKLLATTSSASQSVTENIPEATTSMIAKTTTASIHSQSDRPAQVASMKETHEQVSQEDDATKEATIAFQSTDSESRKQTRRLEEIEKEAVRTLPSQLSMASTPTNSKSSKEAMKTSVAEVASSMASTSKEERVREIEAKDATLALEEQAPKGPTAESQLRTPLCLVEETLIAIQAKDPTRVSGKQSSEILAAKSHRRVTSLPKLEDEHKTSESIMQLQQEGLEETKTTKASYKTNIPFHDNSIDAILKERAKEGSTSEDVVAATMVADLAPRNSRSATSLVVSQVEGSKSGPSTLSSENTEEEAVRIQASQLSMDPIWTNSEITQRIKDTMQQGLEENCEEDDAVPSIGSSNSNSREQSTGLIDNLSGKDSAPIIKETRDHSSVQEEAESEKTVKPILPHHQSRIAEDDVIIVVSTTSDSRKQSATPISLVTKGARDSTVEEEHKLENPTKISSLPNVIPSLHHQAQNADAGPSSISRICEVFQFVELNDGEMTLLAQALKQYPQLLLPHEQLTNRIIAFSYRVLVDILVMLATKTPYTITSSEKSTLESNLREAAFVGFNKNWVDSVRARVMGADMSDVLAAAEEDIQVMEAELQMCDIALEHVRKQRVEAKERLAVTQRQLEMAQNEFEAIDSQMLGLLEDRKKLICRITEFREIVSANDRPFGI